ncbi:MAG TPA: hypothetical protein VF883_20500 [Thermoanaerobaculia bacterium]|jgi:imidazolonepropionase-like amidohydrolase
MKLLLALTTSVVAQQPRVVALKAARTADSAALLGLETSLGTLTAGKLAGIVAVPGNPLTDVTATERVSFVMKEGTIVKGATR